MANSKNWNFLKYKKFPKFSNFKKHKISKIVQFRTGTNFQNTAIFNHCKLTKLLQTLVFQVKKILTFLNFPIWTFPKNSKKFILGISENLQFGEFKKIQFGKFQKFVIWKIKKTIQF